MKSRILLIIFCCLCQWVLAQETTLDTIPVAKPVVDSPPVRTVSPIRTVATPINQDSIDIALITQELPIKPQLNYKKLREQLEADLFLPFGKPASKITVAHWDRPSKDRYFYLIAGLMLFFGFIRITFPKYIKWVIDVFFRSSMRMHQIKDQIQHTPLPSLLLNILFIFAGSVFLLFLSEYYEIATHENDWILLAYFAAIITLIAISQYILFKIIGWVFNISSITDIYIFILFLINKIVGIILLPVIVLMAFPISTLLPVVITIISIIFIILLFYRFIMSYKSIGKEIKVGRFHFFIYLCAFEIAPLLILGKVLFDFVKISN